jgi:Tol biopolymer transport system component
MRSKNLIIGVTCLFVLIVAFSMSTKSQKPEETPKFEIIEIGKGADPQWSPDGTKLAFIYKDTICLANADGTEEIKKLFEMPNTAYRYSWLDSTEFLFQETQQARDEEGKLLEITNRLTGISLKGTKRTIVESKQDLASPFFFSAPIFMPDGTVGYFQFPPGQSWGSESAVFKVIKQGRLRPDSSLKQLRAVVIPSTPYGIEGDVWLESLDKSVKKRVTTGKLYSFPQLSPNGTKILVGLRVVDLDGNEKHIGKGGVDTANISESSLDPKWSPDSKKIAYTRVTAKILDQDGQAIEDIAGKIHIANADEGSDLEVIDIPDVIAVGPVWSPDGKKIACTGKNVRKVYVIKLK